MVRTTSNGQRAPAGKVLLMWTSSTVRVGGAASAADAARLTERKGDEAAEGEAAKGTGHGVLPLRTLTTGDTTVPLK